MKYLFEINTTFYKPVYLYINEDSTLENLSEEILVHIEANCNMTRNNIIDIFIQNNTGIISIPNTDSLLRSFVTDNPSFFRSWNGSVHRNIHKIYIMDNHYLSNYNNKKPITEKNTSLKKLYTTFYNMYPTIYL